MYQLPLLRAYIKNCKPKPLKYLFEGAILSLPYSTRSAQRIF